MEALLAALNTFPDALTPFPIEKCWTIRTKKKLIIEALQREHLVCMAYGIPGLFSRSKILEFLNS